MEKKRINMDKAKRLLPKGAACTLWHDTSGNRVRVFVTIRAVRHSHGPSLERADMHTVLLDLLRWAWKLVLKTCGQEHCPWPELLGPVPGDP